uniref:C2H2-type domain-containing protein n=1 Tax=Leersia perrieri TaxID=77586 RepID=A0A0D9XMA8_9ORYZ
MDKHTCKLCFRRFHNGRALGGHMRSHVMAAAAVNSPSSPAMSLASTSSTEIEMGVKKTAASYVLRENPKKSYKVFDAGEFSGDGVVAAAGGESSVVQDGESDAESSPRGGGAGSFAVSRRRSKRPRRRPAAAPTSSVSDATPEEDVAMSLVLLSRDSWTRSRSENEQNNHDDDVFDMAGDGEEDYNYGDAAAARRRSRYKCGACRKVFRSYQALGGHRASLKKGKGGCCVSPPPPAASSGGAATAAIHECPFCFRVFESGQALGGHKRVHMSSAGVAQSPSPSPAKCWESSGSIDLNMPAAIEDDFELSAVYDAEFASNRE